MTENKMPEELLVLRKKKGDEIWRTTNGVISSFDSVFYKGFDYCYEVMKERESKLKAQLDEAINTLEIYAEEDHWNVLLEFDINLDGFALGDIQHIKAQQALRKIEEISK